MQKSIPHVKKWKWNLVIFKIFCQLHRDMIRHLPCAILLSSCSLETFWKYLITHFKTFQEVHLKLFTRDYQQFLNFYWSYCHRMILQIAKYNSYLKRIQSAIYTANRNVSLAKYHNLKILFWIKYLL